jgi:malate dehydrogenase (oxaloacetate-decarboxylating)(NADP+)
VQTVKIPTDWTFRNADVAKGFDRHVREQLPWYGIATGAVAHIARHFVAISTNEAEVRRFGIEPKIALISHSDFGSHDSESARKMRRAAELIAARAPQIEVDGEMQADSALSDKVRERVLPHSNLKGVANILLMPDLDAANIANELTKVIGDALPVGPILLGTAYPAHIATSTTTARAVFTASQA